MAKMKYLVTDTVENTNIVTFTTDVNTKLDAIDPSDLKDVQFSTPWEDVAGLTNFVCMIQYWAYSA